MLEYGKKFDVVGLQKEKINKQMLRKFIWNFTHVVYVHGYYPRIILPVQGDIYICICISIAQQAYVINGV